MSAGEAPARGEERTRATIAGLAQQALAGADLEALLQAVAGAVVETLAAPLSAVWEVEPGARALRLVAGVGWAEGVVGEAAVPVDPGNVVGYALLAAQPVVVDDLRAERRFEVPEVLAAHGVLSELDVPIAAHGLPRGVLSAFGSEPRLHTKSEVHLAEAIASILALAGERQRSEKALMQTAAQLRGIFRTLPNLYFRLAADGTILAYEAGRAADLYLPPAEFLGRRMQEVLPPPVGERFARAIQQALTGDRLVRFEYSLPIRGRLNHYEASLVSLPARELMAIVANVTARRRAEEGQRFLAEAGRRLASSLDPEATLQEAARLAVPALADWSAVELWSDGALPRQAAAHVDRRQEGLVRRAGHLLFLEPTPPMVRPVREGRSVLLPGLDESLWRGLARDDEHRRLLQALGARSLLIVPLMARERLLGSLLLARTAAEGAYDEMDQALAEKLGRRAALSLDNAHLYQQAQEAVRARDEFISLAAHELKTPVTKLRGFAQLELRRLQQQAEVDPERVRRALQVIDEQSGRLAFLVERVLEVALIEAGRLELALQTADVAALARGVVQEAQAQAPRHTFRLQAPPALAARIDRGRLREVILSLLDNAVKFSWEGGPIEIELSTPTPADWRLSVRDYGVGVPPEQRSEIFGRYFRAHPPRHFPGLGLGLYFSQRIVELHGGHIEAEFPPDGGTRIIITVPRGLEPPPGDAGG